MLNETQADALTRYLDDTEHIHGGWRLPHYARTAALLRAAYKATGCGHFFDPETIAFFGSTRGYVPPDYPGVYVEHQEPPDGLLPWSLSLFVEVGCDGSGDWQLGNKTIGRYASRKEAVDAGIAAWTLAFVRQREGALGRTQALLRAAYKAVG